MSKQLGVTYGSVAKKVAGLEFQIELFRTAKMTETMAERNVFVLNDGAKEKLDRGEQVDLACLGNYKLVKRETPISIFETGDGIQSVNSSRGYGAAMGGLTVRKGKYNDEDRLVLQDHGSMSIEVGEVAAWATM